MLGNLLLAIVVALALINGVRGQSHGVPTQMDNQVSKTERLRCNAGRSAMCGNTSFY